MAPAPPRAGGKGSGLSKKVGPLKGWQWLIVIGGGLVLGIYLRRRMAASQAGAQAAGTDTTGTTGTTGSTPVDAGQGGAAAGPVNPDLSGPFQSVLDALLGSQQALLGSEAFIVSSQQQAYDFINHLYPSGLTPPGGTQPPPPSGPPPPGADPFRPPAGSIFTTPTAQGFAAAYLPRTGETFTPQGVTIAPTVSYSSTPGGVTGPSPFAFK